jgi:hypothetical protein
MSTDLVTVMERSTQCPHQLKELRRDMVEEPCRPLEGRCKGRVERRVLAREISRECLILEIGAG